MGIKGFLKNIIFSVLAVTIFFGSLEIIQRVRYSLRNKDAGYLFYGSSDIELHLAKIFKKINPGKASDNDEVIIVVGGSTVYCPQMKREEAWPEQLERIYRANGYGRVKVINEGKSGSSSLDDLNRLRDFLRTSSPRLIIFYTSVNDSASMLAAKVNDSYVLENELKTSFPERLNSILLQKSVFYMTLREKISKVLSKDMNKAYHRKWNDAAVKKHKMELVDGLGVKRLRGNLENAALLTKKMGIRIVFGSPPVAMNGTYRLSYDRLRKEMKDVAIERDIPYMDMALIFDNMPDKADYFLPDKLHVNPKGARRQAEIFYYSFNDNGINGIFSKTDQGPSDERI